MSESIPARWLEPGALVPVDAETTARLIRMVAALEQTIKREREAQKVSLSETQSELVDALRFAESEDRLIERLRADLIEKEAYAEECRRLLAKVRSDLGDYGEVMSGTKNDIDAALAQSSHEIGQRERDDNHHGCWQYAPPHPVHAVGNPHDEASAALASQWREWLESFGDQSHAGIKASAALAHIARLENSQVPKQEPTT